MTDVRLTLIRESGDAVDLVVTVGPDTTVGEVAHALATRDPARGPAWPAVTLAVGGTADGTPLPADALVATVGPRSGARVRLMPASRLHAAAEAEEPAATLEIVAGPDAGRGPFPLPAGNATVGRDRACAVRLTDPLVSKHHARITVGDVVEIVDLGAANGVYVDGRPVERAVLRSGDEALLGDTAVRVTVRAAGATHARAPLVVPRHAGAELDAPAPPVPPRPRRPPVLALVGPVTAGVVLVAITGSPYAWLLVALGPVAAAGAYALDALGTWRAENAAVATFRTALANLDARLRAAADAERIGRAAEHPGLPELTAAARRRDPLLWSRRPDGDDFLVLRLGLGPRPSRTRVTPPPRTEAPQRLWDELRELVTAHATVDGLPVVVKLPEVGALGVAGHGGSAVPLARALLAQLVSLHAPAEVRLAAVVSPATVGDWRWLAWLPHTARSLFAHPLTADASAAAGLLAEIDALIERRAAGAEPTPAVIVLVAGATSPSLVRVAERGPRHGVYVIWVADLMEHLPGACRAYVEARPGVAGSAAGSGVVGLVATGELVSPVALEALGAAQADEFGRLLAPIVDAGASAAGDAGVTIRTLDLGPGELWPAPA
ncbi:FHA domain-containing protein [Luedemannella helvata]|uniref:FHA domain-containing protein n=1 Tax=Luedemannella helvata TaxID=349315 RepID=UPI0031D6AF80